MASWEQLGELANVGQLVGLNAGQLIGLIVQAANTARMHRRNCRHFARHLKLISNLLEQLRISELKKYPETREPLEQLEDALRRSYVLVDSCQNRSYLYLLAMGWNIVYQFRRAQNEIDRYLKIIPLIALVDNARIKERLGSIERDDHEYTLDEQDREMKDAILERDPSAQDMALLKKSLSCSYPNMPFREALKKENEKLKMELHRSNTNRDVGQLEVIQRLIHVTETVASTLEEEHKQPKSVKKLEADHPAVHNGKDDFNRQSQCEMTARSASSISSGHDAISYGRSNTSQDWHSDLLGCFSEPYLCCKTIFYPCGTISQIASVAKNQTISPAEVCNDLMAYSLLLSCCCYTCCIRRRLRNILNINGGFCDDFLSHLLCCCCALVQEWREVEIRELRGSEMTRSTPPASQYMEF